jgi:hypothetical protein
MKRLLLALSLISLCLMAAPQPARAYSFFSNTDCSSAADTTVCTERGKSGNPISGTNGVLLKITNIIAYVAGAAAIIVIIVGAIRFITSGSDTSVGSRIDDDVLNAKRSISYALIGLAIVVLAKTLITYFIKRVS